MPAPVRLHKAILFKTEPTPVQIQLYETDAHGYATRTPTEEQLDATICVSISSVTKGDTPLYFFVAPALHASVLFRFKAIAQRLLGEVQSEKNNSEAARIIQQWLSRVMLGAYVGAEVPVPRWVAYGLSKDDPIPEWMKEGLL